MVMSMERVIVLKVLAYADSIGYGNLIAHLKRAWAIKLIKEGLPKDAAISGADVEAYPIDWDYLGLDK